MKKGAVIGIGAILLDGSVVGERAMVAAGSVVTTGMHIPSRHLVSGVPAKVKKELNGESLRWVEQSPDEYARLTESYLRQGLGQVDNGEEPGNPG